MDWVKSHQIRSKRGLARQLDELSDRQRQNEIQREREMRDITLDLQRYQKKSTRDLNEILQDRTSGSRAIQRRLSLPAIHASLLPSHPSTRLPGHLKEPVISRSPRSRRRLSIAASLTESPEPTPPPAQPGHKLRRLSVDGGIWGAPTPREALEAGGYKLTRSFTSVNRRQYAGALFDEPTQTLTEVNPLSDTINSVKAVNGRQHNYSVLYNSSARRKSSPSVTPVSSSPVDSHSSLLSPILKSKDSKASKLISISSAALIDNKKTATIVKPIISEISPEAPARVNSPEFAAQEENGHSDPDLDEQKSLSHEDSKAEKECDSSSDIKIDENSREAENSLPSQIKPLPIEAEASKALIIPENLRDETTPSTATLDMPSTSHVTMPGNRRELLHNRLHMEDTADHPHKTTVFIHEDNAVLRVLEDGTVKAEEEILEESEHSMFVSGNRSRRLSEPALGGHFLRELQEKALAEIALSKSIKSNLPSDMVAEEDEEEEEAEEEAKTGDNKKQQLVDISELKIQDETSPKPAADNAKHNTKDETDVSKPSETNKTVSVKENGKVSKGKSPQKGETTASPAKEKESFNALKHRRRSDGDVLRFAKVFRVKNQRVTSGKTRKESENSSSSSSGDAEPMTEKDKVWEAVRRCRYIRGYEPPETEVAANLDISEFVFGHRDPRSVAD